MADADRLNEIREWTAGEDGCDISADDAKFLLAALDAAEQRAARVKAELKETRYRLNDESDKLVTAVGRAVQAEQELKALHEAFYRSELVWQDRAEAAEARATKATNALKRVMAEYHAREHPDPKLPFRMKEHALRALADLAAEEKPA